MHKNIYTVICYAFQPALVEVFCLGTNFQSTTVSNLNAFKCIISMQFYCSKKSIHIPV